MKLASTLWSTVSGMTRQAARVGILKSVKLNARVISVGNIQVGGAGKTPLVAQIAREAHERGLKTCILTRGYQGQWERKGGVLIPGAEPILAALSGDEPALLRELCPHAYIGVGAHREQQYQAVLKNAGTPMDLVVLDDGFQNWRIQKDLEIVALTSSLPEQVLFRDHPQALKHADLVVWTKGAVCPPSEGKPLVRIRYQLPRAPGQDSLWLVTGIANGQSAYSLAVQSGYQILRYLPFRDHARYERPSVEQLLKQAAKVGCKIALTGKDWVKWRDLGVTSDQVLILEPELVFEQGKEIWSKLLWNESPAVSS